MNKTAMILRFRQHEVCSLAKTVCTIWNSLRDFKSPLRQFKSCMSCVVNMYIVTISVCLSAGIRGEKCIAI